MASTLHIRLLGELRLAVDGLPLAAVDAPRVQALLAYLLLHRHAPQARQQIAFLFWPDSPEAQARTNLRQLLHYLRRDLPRAEAFLHADAKTLAWRPDAPFSLDVADFETALGRAERAEDAAERRRCLAEAVTHYGGELLPSCYDEWVFPIRERLHQHFVGALEHLTQLCQEEGDYPAAVRYAQRLLQHDPVQETAYRQLMRLYALSGERARALHVYHSCATVLRRELGVEPSAASRKLYERLIAAETPSPPRELPAAGAPLVGRQAAWAQLLAAWRSVREQERVHLVWIAGEAGIGKTRLVETLLEWAAQQGVAAAKARAYAAGGGSAYAPVTEWLRSEPLHEALAKLDDVWLSEVARLLPELLVARPELPRPEPLTERWQRGRLYEALNRAMLGTRHPLLLVLDDAQWSDRETLGWLRHLLQLERRAPLLVVVAARPEEVTPEHPLAALLLELRSRGKLTDLPLGPLDEAETARLAEQLAGRALGPELEADLYRESEGNPLFVVELVRAGLKAAHGQAERTGPRIPTRIQAVLQVRLMQLSSSARELAELAATIGREFTFEVLARASDLGEDALVRSLDELWQRRIVREQGGDAYDFSHDKLRDAASAAVSSARYRVLHRRVAEALEVVHAPGLDAVSARIARHLERAALPDRALPYLRRAAAAEQRIYANEDAVALLDRALALLEALPDASERDEQELALRVALGVSLVALRGYAAPEVVENYTRAQTLCRQLGKPPHPPILRALAIACVVRSELNRARALGEELLELARREDDAVLRVEAHYVLGVTLFWQGDLVAARAQLEQALARYDAGRRPVHLALYTQDPRVICLSRLAFLLWCLGHPDQASEKSREALALAQALAHPFSSAYASIWAALLHSQRRDAAATAAQAECAVRLCREHQLGLWLPMGTMLQGWAQAQGGDVRAGILRLREGLADFGATGATFLRPYFLALLADLHGETGDAERGLALVAEALAAAQQHGERWCEPELRLLQGRLYQSQGKQKTPRVEAAFQSALEIAQEQDAQLFALRAATRLAREWRRQGRSADAKTLLAPVYARFTEGFESPELREARALLEV